MIWKVSPKGESQARSHNDNEFPMHTDASFEDCPPNFISLYVERADRNGGGLSRLVKLEDIIEKLPKECVEILMEDKF